METFHFLIPTSVIAEMGLTTDGQTVSKQVRISDLVADGTLSVSDYHMLALAGVVVTQQIMFTFHSVEETDDGWTCHQIEPEPRAWPHTREFLEELFQAKVSISSLLREIETLAEENEEILRRMERHFFGR